MTEHLIDRIILAQDMGREDNEARNRLRAIIEDMKTEVQYLENVLS